MRPLTAAIIMTGCLSLMGCSYLQQHPDAYIKQTPVCFDSECRGAVQTMSPDAPQEMVSELAALEPAPLAGRPAVEQKQHGRPLTSHICDLEQQLAHQDREMALHHSGSSDHAKLSDQLSTRSSEMSWSQGETNRLAADLAAANKSIIDLQLQLDQRNESLIKAERTLLKALQTEILRVECRSIRHEREAYEGLP